jgi:acyl-CoA synthetase (NDP forming)
LREALGGHVALANPLDYHTFVWGDRAAIARTFTAMMQGDLSLGVVVADFPRADRCDGSAWGPVIEAVSDTKAASGRPMAILATLPETMPEDVAETLTARGIVPLCGVDDGLRAIAAAAWLGQGDRRRPAAAPGAGALSAPRLLSEAEAKDLLARFGVDIPRGATVAGPEAAADAAERIGFPVVLKASGLAHKTEAGGVALNLSERDSVLCAARKMKAESYLVEEMVGGGVRGGAGRHPARSGKRLRPDPGRGGDDDRNPARHRLAPGARLARGDWRRAVAPADRAASRWLSRRAAGRSRRTSGGH